MKNGNLLYQSLKLPPDQSNLDAREALQTRSDNFGLQIAEEPVIYSPAFMTDKLNQICSYPQDQCVIVIAPPDKQFATLLQCNTTG